MKKFANGLSYLFHPLLMATYGCLIVFFGLTNTIYYVFTPFKLKVIITLSIFSFTFLLPVLNLLILYKLQYISSLKLEDRRERLFPLIMTSICYFGLFYMVYDFNIWPAIKLFVLGGGACILLAGIITIWWQISAHMIGIGGVIGALLAICVYMKTPLFLVLSLCILLAGFIAFARLFLKAHTPAQIYAGFVLGCVIQFSLYVLAQNLTFV